MSYYRIQLVNKNDCVVNPATSDKQDEIITLLEDGSNINIHSEATVSFSTETDLLTYTVPTAKILKIVGYLGTGEATGRYTLKVVGTSEAIIRTSAASRTATADFTEGPVDATAGQIVKITGFHEETPNLKLQCNLYGKLIDA